MTFDDSSSSHKNIFASEKDKGDGGVSTNDNGNATPNEKNDSSYEVADIASASRDDAAGVNESEGQGDDGEGGDGLGGSHVTGEATAEEELARNDTEEQAIEGSTDERLEKSDDQMGTDPAEQGGQKEGDPKEGESDQPPREGEVDQPPREGEADQPPREGEADQPPKEGESDQPPKEGEADQPPSEREADQPLKESDQPSREGEVDQPVRGGESDHPPRKEGVDQPPREGQTEQSPREEGDDQSPKEGEVNQPSKEVDATERTAERIEEMKEQNSEKETDMCKELTPEIEETPDLGSREHPIPESRLTDQGKGTNDMDNVLILSDIVEEDEVESSEKDRKALLEEYKRAMEEKNIQLTLCEQIQQRIAECLAKRKIEERGDPGRVTIDHQKKFMHTVGTIAEVRLELEEFEQEQILEEAKLSAMKDEGLADLKQARNDFMAYRKKCLLNIMDTRTGKRITATDIEHYHSLEEEKEADIVQIRLENIKLLNKMAKLEASLREKEQLADGLHMIDFEQLKINNIDLNEKIEERNDDILKLKKKVTSTIQVLTHVKEKLQFLQADTSQRKGVLNEIEADLAQKRDELTHLKQAHDAIRADNLRLKQKGGLVGHMALLRDYEERQDQSKGMRQRLEVLQKRHSELSVMCNGFKQKIEKAKLLQAQAHR